MTPENYISVTELCADHPNLLEYVSGLERQLLNAKCDLVDAKRDCAAHHKSWVNAIADCFPDDHPCHHFEQTEETIIDAIKGLQKQIIKTTQDRYDDVARWKTRCATIESHYATLRAELVESEAKSLYNRFQAAACGKDMDHCRTLANARLRCKCEGCNGTGEVGGQFPDGSYQTDVCPHCEGNGFVEIPELPSGPELVTHNIPHQLPPPMTPKTTTDSPGG